MPIMKLTLWMLPITGALAMAGCGTKVTHDTGDAKPGEAAGVEVSVRSSVKGQIASNIVQASDNVRKMTQVMKEDVTQVTGKVRLVAGQVSDSGVNAGVYLSPRTQVQWKYKVISPAVAELEAKLNHLGEEGWELFSERTEDGKTSYILKRRGP